MIMRKISGEWLVVLFSAPAVDVDVDVDVDVVVVDFLAFVPSPPESRTRS